MKPKTNTVVFSVLAVILLFYVLWAVFAMPVLESKLLPITIGGITLLLTVIGLVQAICAEFKPRKESAAEAVAPEKGGGEAKGEPWGLSLINFSWVLGFLLGIYLLGYIIAIGIFVLAYMRRLGTKWRTAAICAVVIPALIYAGFEIGLQLPLYRGLLFSWWGD